MEGGVRRSEGKGAGSAHREEVEEGAEEGEIESAVVWWVAAVAVGVVVIEGRDLME